jgi:hypothetical protein
MALPPRSVESTATVPPTLSAALTLQLAQFARAGVRSFEGRIKGSGVFTLAVAASMGSFRGSSHAACESRPEDLPTVDPNKHPDPATSRPLYDFLLGCDDGRLRVLDRQGRLRHTRPLDGAAIAIRRLSCPPGRTQVALGTSTGQVVFCGIDKEQGGRPPLPLAKRSGSEGGRNLHRFPDFPSLGPARCPSCRWHLLANWVNFRDRSVCSDLCEVWANIASIPRAVTWFDSGGSERCASAMIR